MVNLFIRSFAKIDDVKMEYSVQITFRQKWSDDRLAYKHRLTEDMSSKHHLHLWCTCLQSIKFCSWVKDQQILTNISQQINLTFSDSGRIKYLTMTDARKVWMPDTFFRNEKEGRFHNILVPNVYIRIFPEGYVLYSIRLVSSYKLRSKNSGQFWWKISSILNHSRQ